MTIVTAFLKLGARGHNNLAAGTLIVQFSGEEALSSIDIGVSLETTDAISILELEDAARLSAISKLKIAVEALERATISDLEKEEAAQEIGQHEACVKALNSSITGKTR